MKGRAVNGRSEREFSPIVGESKIALESDIRVLGMLEKIQHPWYEISLWKFSVRLLVV